MKIAIDVMGFDHDKIEPIEAAKKFIKSHKDVEIVFVGKNFSKTNNKHITYVEANDVVSPNDNTLLAMRNTNTSMYKTIELLKNNEVDGILTAGSTAPFVALSYALIGTIKNIDKPAFMSYVPTINGHGFLLLDEGANITCTGQDLYIFGIMAHIYSKYIRKISSPSIAVLNIGTEEKKGYDFHHDANTLFKNNNDLNYQGYLEPRYVLDGKIDIVVSDGYTGNITLKTLEGSLKGISTLIKKTYKKPQNLLGYLFSIPSLLSVKKRLSYVDNAGAFVIGLKKNVVKTHGSAKRDEWYSAIRMLYDSISINLPKKIEDYLDEHIKQ